MEQKNRFYVATLGKTISVFFGYSWATGEYAQDPGGYIGSTVAIDVKGYSRFIIDEYYTKGTSITIYYLDESENVVKTYTLPNGKIDVSTEGAAYLAYSVSLSVNYTGYDALEALKLKEVKPYYKNIKKQYKKESNQMFFRESIDGKITLRGSDFEHVNNISIEDNIAFYIYRNGEVYAVNEFNKTDCKINHSEYSIELKLKPKDKYDKLLNDYDKSHDLLKMPIAKSFVELTKRCAIQLYFQGDNTITNYAGGTYWEEEVTQPVYDAGALRDKYHFSDGLSFNEINLSGFNYDINTVYKMVEGQNIWNGTEKVVIGGTVYERPSSIVFTKKISKGDRYAGDGTVVRWLSSANITPSGGIIDGAYNYMVDAFQIEIYTDHDGGGRKIYQSEMLYANDTNFVLIANADWYKMIKVSQDVPYKEPEPESFYLGEKIISRYLWGRLLCDVDVSTDGTHTYDLPYDDFATERANFKKCVGLKFKSNNGMNLVHFAQSDVTQDEPTPFGVNDSGKYFVVPRIYGSVAYELYPYPFAKSSWGNTSLWVGFEENKNLSLPSLENFRKTFYKSIYHKDCMEISSVIKALLEKIDSTIKFDSSPEYSEFLYGTPDNSVGKLGQKIYITQKSNVLKGEYDQAAQKGEITFGQVMDMLKNCFRCYWYIDSERRFRIEHVRYFMNGLSYSLPERQYDLTATLDKFNKKSTLYGQQEISYSKSELKSRYEFAWSDDSTEMMGGGFSVDVISNYIEQGSTESINVDLFSSDLDFMMFAPDRFSQDGFALIVTDSNKKVPIVYATAHNQQNPGVEMTNYVQNYYASFLYLFNNYLYDMPARTIISSADYESGDKKFYVIGIKKCVEHKVKFQPNSDPNIYKLITTERGDGSIDDLTVDIDTGLVDVTLVYTPK